MPNSARDAGRSPADLCDRSHFVYLNNRYHDAVIGAFISVDPLVVKTGQAYMYGNANPITYSDPTGLDPDTSATIRKKAEEADGCTYSSGLECFEDKHPLLGYYQYRRAGRGYNAYEEPQVVAKPLSVGPGSGSGGDGPGLLDRAGHVGRFVLNLPIAVPAAAYAEVWGGDCSLESGLVTVCTGLPTWANGPADSLSVGAILSEYDRVEGDHLRHETAHMTQSAILGPYYVPAFIAGAAATAPIDVVRGCSLGTHNPLEAIAGPGGGYGC